MSHFSFFPSFGFCGGYSIIEFTEDPYQTFLDHCVKGQLLTVAEQYHIDITDKKAKGEHKNKLKKRMVETGVLCQPETGGPANGVVLSPDN